MPTNNPDSAQSDDNTSFLTVAHLARLFGRHQVTIRLMAKRGDLPSPLVIKGRRLWRRVEIEDWIEANRGDAKSARSDGTE